MSLLLRTSFCKDYDSILHTGVFGKVGQFLYTLGKVRNADTQRQSDP